MEENKLSILPPSAKASGNYTNSIIANVEAKKSGRDEAILLSTNGYVAEGSGENIFLVQDGKLVTPSKASDILPGITRDSILKIAQNMGLETEEREVHREELYNADETILHGNRVRSNTNNECRLQENREGKTGADY